MAAAKKRYSRARSGGGSSNREWAKVEMHCADIITDLRWLSGDIIFANSTCFDIALMRALAAVAAGAPHVEALHHTQWPTAGGCRPAARVDRGHV